MSAHCYIFWLNDVNAYFEETFSMFIQVCSAIIFVCQFPGPVMLAVKQSAIEVVRKSNNQINRVLVQPVNHTL